MQYSVAQLGARMHYSVPRILFRAGMLAHFHTDICAVKGWPSIVQHLLPQRLQPKGLRRLLGRVPAGISATKIQAYTSFGWEYSRRRREAATQEDETNIHLWAGEAFCRLVLSHGLHCAEAIYTFNSAGLEIQQEANRLGLRSVMEQTIAPRVIEQELLAPEFAQFSELKGGVEPLTSWQRYAARETAEWDAADVILCGSQFVADGIGKAGGPVEKTVVVPYGIDLARFTPTKRELRTDKYFHVLFVGQVGIRKGAHYLIEAARLLEKRRPEIIFRLVGTIALPVRVLNSLPSNVQLIGPIPRIEISKQFGWADIFCLPSLCEGSATVTYEALTMGLPVICTQNTGSLVNDGKDGFLVPICDSEAIAERIIWLADPDRRRSFSIAALDKAKHCSLEAYAARLLAVL